MKQNYSQSYLMRMGLTLVFIALDIGIIFFVNPEFIILSVGMLPVIIFMILFQGIVVYLVSSLFLPVYDQFLISTGIVVFLSLTYVFGFQILNTILLLLFIITVRIILYK